MDSMELLKEDNRRMAELVQEITDLSMKIMDLAEKALDFKVQDC